MFELATKPKKSFHYEPIERRRADRRDEADRRTENREDESDSDRRQSSERRK